MGFVLSIPFVGIIVYQYFTRYNQLGLAISIEEFLINNIGSIIITIILLLCIISIFICMYTYGNFLTMNVYKHYLEGEKLPYTKNLYFSGKHFRAYIGILGWMSLYLLAPIIIGIMLIIPFGILAKTTLGLSTLVIGSISLLIFIILFTWFIHLLIRLIFSYYTLLYSEEVGKAKSYIDESFRLTKKRVWKIIFLILPFLISIAIIASIMETGVEKNEENGVYSSLIEIQKQSGQDDHKLLEGFFIGNEESKAMFGKIEKEFTPQTQGINKDFLHASLEYIDVKTIYPSWWIFTTLFGVFSFLVFEGLTSMLYISTYHIILGVDEKNSWKASTK